MLLFFFFPLFAATAAAVGVADVTAATAAYVGVVAAAVTANAAASDLDFI